MNRNDEIFAVRQLGEKIGYGNMMSLASALWIISLEDKYGLSTGNFVPTLVGMIKEEEQEHHLMELTRNKKDIRKRLISIKD